MIRSVRKHQDSFSEISLDIPCSREMAPVPAQEAPSNIAQLGMGWNLATGTIDLGLTFFDAIFVVRDWIRDFLKHKARQTKKAELIRKGKRSHSQRDGPFTSP